MKKYLVNFLMHDLDYPEIRYTIFGNKADNRVKRSRIFEGNSKSEIIEKITGPSFIVDGYYGIDVILDICEV